jgi:hypothetical protein
VSPNGRIAPLNLSDFAAVHETVIGTSLRSRHRNILSAFGEQRTLIGTGAELLGRE